MKMHPNKFAVLGSAAGLLLAFCEVGGETACQHLVSAKAYSHKHGMPAKFWNKTKEKHRKTGRAPKMRGATTHNHGQLIHHSPTVVARVSAIKARIRALCDAEDPKKVLSDEALAGLLKQEGYDLARRTVAKYREAIGIGSSAQRRRQKKLAAL